MRFKNKSNHTIFNIAVAMTVLLYLLFNNAGKPKSLNIYVITYTYMLLNFWWWKWWKHYHTCKYDFIPHIVLVLENMLLEQSKIFQTSLPSWINHQGSANIFWKGSDIKFLRLCGPRVSFVRHISRQ